MSDPSIIEVLYRLALSQPSQSRIENWLGSSIVSDEDKALLRRATRDDVAAATELMALDVSLMMP